MTKIIPLPGRWRRRFAKAFGWRAVPCQISDRWLRFPDAFNDTGDEEWVFFDVMTGRGDLDGDGPEFQRAPRKICEVCVDRRELLRVLNGLTRWEPPAK